MDLPKSAAGSKPEGRKVRDLTEIIFNPFYGKELLTPFEAINAINLLSQALMMNETRKGPDEYKRYCKEN